MSKSTTASLCISMLHENSLAMEAMTAHIPAMWRKSKFRIKGLEKAAKYNDLMCVVKGEVPEGHRLKVQVQNDERSEIAVRRANLELTEHKLDSDAEPELARALDRLQLSRSKDVPRDKKGVEAAAVNWAQGLLDVTFSLENRMVGEGFDKEALADEVLGALEGVEVMCLRLQDMWVGEDGAKAADEDDQVAGLLPKGTAAMVAWLGEGMAECVHWRRGALQYMLIATKAAEHAPLSRRVLGDGLAQLELFLQTRGGRMSTDLEETEGDDGVREMIKARVLGDTHLLAIVYAGEMCYWGCTEQATAGEEAVLASEFLGLDGGELDGEALRKLGVDKLQMYLRVVALMTTEGGGGVGSGWDTTRAQGLLSDLKKL